MLNETLNVPVDPIKTMLDVLIFTGPLILTMSGAAYKGPAMRKNAKALQIRERKIVIHDLCIFGCGRCRGVPTYNDPYHLPPWLISRAPSLSKPNVSDCITLVYDL